jgi:hypothetical protein
MVSFSLFVFSSYFIMAGQTDLDPNPPLIAGNHYSYPPPLNIIIPPSAKTIPTAFGSLLLSIVSLFNLHCHLGPPQHPALYEKDADGTLCNWIHLEHADVAFLCHGISRLPSAASPPGDWHPMQQTLHNKSGPLGHRAKACQEAFTDKIFQNLVDSVHFFLARYRPNAHSLFIFSFQAVALHCTTGGVTMILHSKCVSQPNSPVKPKYMKCYVVLPSTRWDQITSMNVDAHTAVDYMVQLYIHNITLPNKQLYDGIHNMHFGTSTNPKPAKVYWCDGLIPTAANGVYTWVGRAIPDADQNMKCVEISTYNSLMKASNAQNVHYNMSLLTTDELRAQLQKLKSEAKVVNDALHAARLHIQLLEEALAGARDEAAKLRGEMDELLLELHSMLLEEHNHTPGPHVPIPFQVSDSAPPLPRPVSATSTPRSHHAQYSSASTPVSFQTAHLSHTPPGSPFKGSCSSASQAGWEWHPSQLSQHIINKILAPATFSPSPSPPPFNATAYVSAAKEILLQWGHIDLLVNVTSVTALPRSQWLSSFAQLNLDNMLCEAIIKKWETLASLC